ncbi:unnamed protein product [Periconia digitata]|uniref:Zn(2)-C6 fungal-type domain-containing protein n=1 Tax=Periconia digitata TaxID=1303443 RepID=A0A9W4U6A8_9PLEO|nr:unnamed protein product [Periconia digitata]
MHHPTYETAGDQASKVAIPRLERRHLDRSAERKGDGRQEKRVRKACTNCRKRKVKCSGEQPSCLNCEAAEIECYYEPARRDKLRSATHQNQSLIALLNDLRLRVNDADKQTIDDALKHVDDGSASHTNAHTSTSSKRRKPSSASADDPYILSGEDRAPASIGSNEDLDLLDEDLLRSKEARETGYAGKNSTVAWLRSLQKEVKNADGQPYGLPYGPAGADYNSTVRRSEALHERRRQSHQQTVRPETTETSFYLDTDGLELNATVNPYQLPPYDVAEKLFDFYMRTVYKSFPITPSTFPSQFKKFFEAIRSERAFQVPDKWLALLNLCFAVGSQYSTLTGQERHTDTKEHRIYMTRAVRLLGLKDNLLFAAAPDLPTIQATGLLSFYYMSIGHVSRAWVMIGIAIRFALALGLHLRNEDPNTPASKKDTLVRTWWSLHAIECLVSSVTGRPCVLAPEDCTAAFPYSFRESGSAVHQQDATHEYSKTSKSTGASSSAFTGSDTPDSVRKTGVPGSALEAHIAIGLITQKVLSSIYAPRVATRSWSYIQSLIPSLLAELEEWRGAVLPYRYGKFVNPFPPPDGDRESFLLRFYYYSNLILITRPCLCRIERRITGQSDFSFDFNETTAKRCVQAAQDMADLLPEDLNLKYLLENGPWWIMVHHIMQSMTVLLLELSYQSTHISGDDSSLTPRIRKLVRWLRVMRATDPSSERAYNVVVNIIRHSGNQFHTKAEHLLDEDDTGIYMTSGNQQAAHGSAEGFTTSANVAGNRARDDRDIIEGLAEAASHHPAEISTATDPATARPTKLSLHTNTTGLEYNTLNSMPQSAFTPTTASFDQQSSSQGAPLGAEGHYPFYDPYNNLYANPNPFMTTSFDQNSWGMFVGSPVDDGYGGAEQAELSPTDELATPLGVAGSSTTSYWQGGDYGDEQHSDRFASGGS